MITQKEKDIQTNQTFLAVLMALIVLSGFIGVYYVSSEYEKYETVNSELKYASDSNLQWHELDTTESTTGFPQPYGIGTYKSNGADSNNPVSMTRNNCTPVYTGNNTWSAGMTGFPGDATPLTYMWHHLPIVLPEVKNIIVDTISLKFTMPGDVYQHLQILIGANDNPENAGFVNLKTLTLVDLPEHGSTEYENYFKLGSYAQMFWYNACQQADDPIIVIYMFGDAANGISSFALDLTLNITGVSLLSWSLQDSINLVVGLHIVLCTVALVYSTDGVDWGKVEKVLKGGKK